MWTLSFDTLIKVSSSSSSSRDTRVICSSVSCSFDRFLMYCLCDSIALQKRFFSLIFLRSFLSRFWPLCYLCGLLSLFPLLLRSLIRDKSKIHFVYSHTLVISFVLIIHRLRQSWSSILRLFLFLRDLYCLSLRSLFLNRSARLW